MNENQEEFMKAGNELLQQKQLEFDKWFNGLNRRQKRKVIPVSAKFSNYVKHKVL